MEDGSSSQPKTHNGAYPESEHCCIYRVHKGLRNANPDAYTPMLVSIGPYHIKDSNLKKMDKYKQRYTDSLLKRDESKKAYCKLKLKELEGKARGYYADRINLKAGTDGFVEMMLLDGCFIIGFLRESNRIIWDKNPQQKEEDDTPIIDVDSWMYSQICRDMMLLENQLPYFVLDKLFEMIPEPKERYSLWENVILAFNFGLPKPHRRLKDLVIPTDTQVKHLLHAAHIICCSPLPVEEKNSTRCFSLHRKKPENSTGILERMGSVVELQEAGVHFQKIGEVYKDGIPIPLKKEEKGSAGDVGNKEKRDDFSLFEIYFKDGTKSMKIPSFKVEDSTETMFRNLIAYEQHSSDIKCKYFTDFTTFMDQLINSEKDVKILRLKGIIVNLLGDDKKVCDVFNRLNDGVVESRDYYYCKETQRAINYRKKRRNRFRAILMRDYFGNPWTIISTCAAIFLLFLALAQTILALLTVLN